MFATEGRITIKQVNSFKALLLPYHAYVSTHEVNKNET